MKTLILALFLLCVLSGCQQELTPSKTGEGTGTFAETRPATERLAGRKAALGDIKRGVLRLELWGPNVTTPLKFDQILRTRFSIEVGRNRVGAGESWDYLDAYNSVMVEEITRRYGNYVIDNAFEDAQR